MRILAIAPTAFYRDYGCHVRIRGQLLGLQARGHTLRLLTYPVGADVPQLAISRAPVPGLRHIPVGSSWRKVLLDALLGPTATAVALRYRPQHIHAILHEGALIGSLLARMLRISLSFDYQGSLTAEMLTHHFLSPRSPWLPPLQRLEHWLEQQPQVIFTSTQQAITRLSAAGIPRQRLHYLPDAIDPERFRPQPPDGALRQSLDLSPDRPTIVYLGLLAPYQGIDLLLQAIARLTQPAQFLIMGFPNEEHYRRMAVDLGVDTRVRFTGPIPYEQAPRYLALGDLAVAPKLATTEGSGKLLPYMSMALPIIATDTPAHRQYLGDLGLYTTPEPDALAHTLTQALSQLPLLSVQAQQLRAIVQRRYTWQQTAIQMETILQSVL